MSNFYNKYLSIVQQIDSTYTQAYRDHRVGRRLDLPDRNRFPVLLKALKTYATVTTEQFKVAVLEPITVRTKPMVTENGRVWRFYIPTPSHGWIVLDYDTIKDEKGRQMTYGQFVYISTSAAKSFPEKIASFKKYGMGYAALERFLGICNGVVYPHYTKADFNGMMNLVAGTVT